MYRFVSAAGVLTLALLFGGVLSGDDKKPPVRGTLPQNWKKLGLTDEQTQKIYTVQNEYRGKIAELRKQIAALQKQQQAEMEKVLTEAQKVRLREILSEKGPKGDTKDSTPAKDKKPSTVKDKLSDSKDKK
jgi:hypothetical protein